MVALSGIGSTGGRFRLNVPDLVTDVGPLDRFYFCFGTSCMLLVEPEPSTLLAGYVPTHRGGGFRAWVLIQFGYGVWWAVQNNNKILKHNNKNSICKRQQLR